MWDNNKKNYLNRLNKVQPYLKNKKFIEVAALSRVIKSGDKICIEGDN